MNLRAFSKIASIGLAVALSAFFHGCYTFKSSTIPAELNTFFVQNFALAASNAPANIGITFTESLKDKIRSQSRLRLKTEAADCEFSGQITQFSVAPVAPKPGETVSFNQLTIAVEVTFKKRDQETPDPPFRKSFFADFSASTDLLTVQNQLIDDIFKQLTEDVFNQAFNNW